MAGTHAVAENDEVDDFSQPIDVVSRRRPHASL